MKYLVKYLAYSRLFNENYIAQSRTNNYEKYLQTKNVVEIYEIKEIGKSKEIEIIKKIY